MFAKYRIRQVYVKKGFNKKRRFFKAQKRRFLFLWDDIELEVPVYKYNDEHKEYVNVVLFEGVSECSQELERYISQKTEHNPQTVIKFDKKGKRL